VSEFAPYQPSVPAGLPAGHPLPGPRRPRILAILGWVAIFVVLLAFAMLTVLVITAETGALGLVTGVALAAVPVVPVVAVYLWLDRYEAEPPVLLGFAFLWGAGVATFGSLIANSASAAAIQQAGGDTTAAAVVVAPVVEETMKGLAILLILLLRRREFDGVVDGIVYAGMVGIGFAFVENVLYLGRTLADSGVAGTVAVFVLRCVASPFAHPLFTAATGIGLGLAVRARNPLAKVALPVLGWAVAVLLHGTWNYSASAGFGGFVTAYAVVQVPIFAGFVALAVYARRREGRLIARHLEVYSSTGWISPGEVTMLASIPSRRDARSWASRTGGPAARRAMRDFQELASELAFLRERMVRGSAPRDAQTTEYAMLASMSAQRALFLPNWSPPSQTY
jgi:RsiW-degrading membrane proteinase PrsW (M82 family)